MKKLSFFSFLSAIFIICFSVSAFAADFYVISVQNKCGPCKGTSSAGGRWCDNGDGTITDMTTCLVWLKYAKWGGVKKWRSNTVDDYDDANTRAGILASGETISTGGETVYLTDGSIEGDWRLPTKTELSGIINQGGETVCSSKMQLFAGVQSYYYWSSNTYASDTELAWYVIMNDGETSYWSKKLFYYVWPVRSDN
ncbi:MAG: DUF1566 domain-containing protein [Deltaproteobacteria bacterium]|nr:DUF1566 domain-containing protein [Deltaproteobacteria bacterium]